MVATQHPLAAAAGRDILAAGGSAADAAVAAAAVLTVVDARSTGLGGDLFALYWPAGARHPHGLASAGVAPRLMTEAALRAAGHTSMPSHGPWTVTVPGAPAGWSALLGRHGRLGAADLLAAAIGYAENGFVVTPVVADEWTSTAGKLRQHAAAAQTFLVDGAPPRAGDTFSVPDLAGTLRLYANQGPEPFYRGALAQRIGRTVEDLGGPLRSADLAAWAGPEWVHPITTRYRDVEVFEMPPPVQGLVVLKCLRILDGMDHASTADQVHHTIEALKHAFLDASAHVGDPHHGTVPLTDLLSEEAVARARARIAASPPLRSSIGNPTDTVFVATVDQEGNACSLIQSLYDGFGSGVVVPGTGLALQNRGSGFRLTPGHPNSVAPGKRPLHTILPAMLGRSDRFLGCLGVVGGYMQPQGQVQVLRNLLDGGMDPQQALDAPRFRVYRGREVGLEAAVPADIRTDLATRGHAVTELPRFEAGGGQVILRGTDGYLGGSDRRKDGVVLAY